MSTLARFGLKCIVCCVVAFTLTPVFGSKAHCPADVASLPYRLVNRHQIIVDVQVNQSAPLSFLFDTGTQVTMLDPLLASDLHLEGEGLADVTSVGVKAQASIAQVNRLTVGKHSASNLKVLIHDLGYLPMAGMSIRGVLGEDFLERFDMLLDTDHNLLCLDDTGTMRAEVKGPRIPLLVSTSADGVPSSLIVSARLSDGMRPVRLRLDSGTNVSFLYNAEDYLALGVFRGASLQGGGANGAQQVFTALPTQRMKIGSAELDRVQFVTLGGVQKELHSSEFDGLLTLGLFRRVFVNHAEHFAVLDPR
jgi:aspartyl protease